MSAIVGIRLGNSFSSASYLDEMGRPEIITTACGERKTPSAVYFESASQVQVGLYALYSRHADVSRSVRWIQSTMSDESYTFSVDGKEYTPAEISALILKRLRQDAEQQIGSFTNAVITVPANFGEVARKATMDAGTLAGLNVVGIVNEPTAAAIYYAFEHEIKGHALIFGLGGGTFDVSIADVNRKEVKIVTSSGDRHLGGVVFDRKLVEFLERKYKEETGGQLYASEEEKAEIEDYAETIKKSLSKKESVAYRLRGDSGTVRGEITRNEFNSLISSDLARMELLIETALEDANDDPSDIDKVLLVGGSSRIPVVQDMLTDIFGFTPTTVGNVDECITLGAAIYAGLRLLEENPEKVKKSIARGLGDVKLKLGEVCNDGYGIIRVVYDETTKSNRSINDVLIKRDTRIPCTEKRILKTLRDDQRIFRVNSTQGMSSDPDLCNILISATIKLPPGLPKGTPIEITLSYDKDQRASCVIEHKTSGTKLELDYDVITRESSTQTNVEQPATLKDFIIE